MASNLTPNTHLGNSGQRPGELPSTHWSLIFAAAGTGQEAQEALAKLCAIYRAPVLHFVSRRMSNPADAQEFTQQFFADLIARKDISKVNPALGSFHAWLYRCLRNALLNSHRNSSRRPALTSREAIDLNSLCASSPNPEQEFIRQCALVVYLEARRTTRELLPHVWDDVFDAAVPDPAKPQTEEQAALALKHGISGAAFRTRIKEVRIKFRATLYRQLARTAETNTIADEVRALCEAISVATGEVPISHDRLRHE